MLVFRISVRIRVRIRVSFLSRPIHCKHLSLIESTTSSVTSPINGLLNLTRITTNHGGLDQSSFHVTIDGI